MSPKKPPTPAAPVTFDIDAADLLRGLHNARLFTSGDNYLPVICGVHIEGTADDVAFAATDRYSIGVTTIPCQAGQFAFLMRGVDVALLLKLFGPKSGTLTVNVDRSTLTVQPAEGIVSAPQVVVTCRAEEGEFPKYRQILDTAGTPKEGKPTYTPGAALGLNPQYVARFARVKSDTVGRGTEASAMKIHVLHTDSPIIIKIGNQFVGAQMPVRLSESAVVTPKSSAA